MGLLDQIVGGVLGAQAKPGEASSGALGGLGDLLGGLGGGRGQGGAQMLAALLPIVLGMLANRSEGGAGSSQAGGLEALLRQFQAAGLGRQADSWVGTGPNLSVSPDDLTRVLGHDRLSQIASQAGIGEAEAAGGLASLLPEFVDRLTPQGQLPATGEADDALDTLRRSLGL